MQELQPELHQYLLPHLVNLRMGGKQWKCDPATGRMFVERSVFYKHTTPFGVAPRVLDNTLAQRPPKFIFPNSSSVTAKAVPCRVPAGNEMRSDTSSQCTKSLERTAP